MLESVRGSLWLWPTATGVLGLAAAEAMVRLDRALDGDDSLPFWVFSGDADAARSVLSTIATATMSVLGVTLSITLAVLALTAQSYSPRVIRRFLRDRVVQAVTATFVGTFAYALTALRLVRTDSVPGATVSLSVLLAFSTLALLVVFFHHLASQIQAEQIVESVTKETAGVIAGGATRALGGSSAPPAPLAVIDAATATPIAARRSGRLAHVDEAALAALARATGATVAIVPLPGDYVAAGEVVARLVGGRAPRPEEIERATGAITLGRQRILAEDVAFGISQLADVALRALSPSLNDPTTAEEALLRAGALLRGLADRELVAGVVEDGRPLVVRPQPSFGALVELAFARVRRTVEPQGDAATLLVLLDALGRILAVTRDPGRIAVLRDHARLVVGSARRGISEPADLARVEAAAADLI